MAKTEETEGLGGAAARLVSQLAKESVAPHLVSIETDDLGPFPKKVPAIFNAEERTLDGVKAVLEDYRQRPDRRGGTATVETLQSFVDLTNRHKDVSSAIFGKTAWPSPSLVAVIDYHETAEAEHAPRFCKHRVVYPFPVTEELKAWVGGNGEPMEQAEFAAFLEEHAAELASPLDAERSEYELLFKARFGAPSELIALSRDLEVHAGHQVKRQERLQTGERKVYFKEEHMTGDGQPVDIPGLFMVSVPAFVDGAPVRVPARLRYRLAGGITWFYQLYRWEFWLRERVVSDLRDAGGETGLPIFEGTPEA
jgi:hypothetical protein